MQEKYTPQTVERDAQAHWTATDAWRAKEHDPRFPKGKYYACSMLPYPSGKLHMGHVRNYTINDMMARHLRMNGWNVLMPMGWDAFGLPAENAAMANGVAPAAWTWSNIAHMKAQMQSMGLAIDWTREIATCSPDYYKWNQWLFLRMLERGIAYLRTGSVNWDPIDQTVLANEQVIDGRGWRSGALIEKREIPMYYLGIAKYADELIDGLEGLGWPERVKTMQHNWIGRSEGVRFAFPHALRAADGNLVGEGRLYVFTTRADTIMGVTFVAVAPEHPVASLAATDRPDIAAFIERCRAGGVAEADVATREKEGVPTGLFVTHPLSGAAIPVWIGNYVLMSYGDGAVMGVPAHDERDFAFARTYGLPIQQVIAPAQPDRTGTAPTFSDQAWAEWYADKANSVCIHSGELDGLRYHEAVDRVVERLKAQGLGDKRTTLRLRDWGISRQRYWGTPIPIIHCAACGAVPVPDEQLPVVLPDDLVPDGSGNPLAKNEQFLRTTCPRCNAPARRETDTMDTFVDSSWYFMRYCSPDSSQSMVDSRNDYWMPMDQYIGGIEHAVLHLLYARFWTRVMRDVGLVTFAEPFSNLLTQGMVLNDTFYREEESGRKTWFNPDEVDVAHDDKGRPSGAVLRSDGAPVTLGGIEKMSKSKNNGIDPQAQIDQYGADTARLFTIFASPPEQTLEWSGSGVEGAQRFLRRLWNFAYQHQALIKARLASRVDEGLAALNLAENEAKSLDEALRDSRREVHTTLRQADFDYTRRQYNTVVSAAMKLLNTLEAMPSAAAVGASPAAIGVLCEGLGILLRVLAPVVPHITHVIWVECGYAGVGADLIDTVWPQVDETALVRSQMTLVLQINGKVRGSILVPADADHGAIAAAATASDAYQRAAPGLAAPKKIVVVPGRLVNLVI